MSDSLIYMAFVTGLLGTGHCIGMCGGLVSALSLSEAGRQGGWFFHLLYNLGRISTYTFIGAVVGWLGSALAYTDRFKMVTRSLLIGSDVFVILVGLGTAGLFAWLNVSKLDFPGPMKAMTVAVVGLRRLPPAISALPLGLLFGFIPCGYLYAVAITAAQSASVATGALMLFAFGLGTAPSLLLFGSAAHWLSGRARTWMLRVAGLVVAGMGVINLTKHMRMMGWLS
ncbi:MAG: sulfite exporter TauE/SafE family protein [Desulfuromonadales bacterium]|nr:sulfite exporter TauE/SafE family protein [Desulfuromonadales bacterium]MDH4025245.1 sulfite exporter TauE/SafE family protein [Desulfuromonadales bacterium]HKJ29010.1 sulfite exporter TauE/SafE family protein [Desulfuromonadales bacterium]